MSPELDDLRAALAGSLLESLEETIDEDVEVAWQQEIARRMEELDSGKAKTVPWRYVRQKAHDLLRGKQG